MKIIGIAAKKRSGKDTIAEYLIDKHGFERYSFADPLKKGAQEMFGFTDDQMWGESKEVVDERWGITPRKMLQILGTELLQLDIHNHTEEGEFPIGRLVWVHKFKLWVEEQKQKEKEMIQEALQAKAAGLLPEDEPIPELKVVIPDVRFPHEANPIRELGGEIWKVDRPSLSFKDEHASETEIDNIDYDLLVVNDGTIEELFKKVEEKFV